MLSPHTDKRRARSRPGAASFCLFAVIAILSLGPAAAAGQIFDFFIVQYPTISPNGDGVRDSSLVRVALLESCDRLFVILETASEIPIDTLLDIAAPSSQTTYSTVFNGKDGAGAPLPGGSYRLRCEALRGGPLEETGSTVYVDLTAPLVRIERIDPGIYAPGVPGTAQTVFIYYSLLQTGPGDTLSMVITGPSGEGERTTIAAPGDGEYRLEYSSDADPDKDGIYEISVASADEGGNSTEDSGALDMDTKGPTQAFVTKPPRYTNVPPPVITGKAYDRNGISALRLIWDGGTPFIPDSTYMAGDTLYWRFDAIDSLREGTGFDEGTHTIAAQCADLFGIDTLKHRTKIQWTFDLDLTPPSTPVLEQPASPAHEPQTILTGAITYPGTSTVHVFRLAGSAVDTVDYEPTGSPFAVTVPLLEGDNMIRATAEDQAGNLSGLSNTVTVRFEPGNDVAWPEVFRGPDVFRVYSASPAQRATVDIYTVSGELVASLSENGPALAFAIEWDLANDDGEEVRNGPYLAVVTVKYETRTSVYKAFVAVMR